MMEPVAARRWDKTYPGGQWLYFPASHDGEKLVRLSDAEARIAEITKWRDEWKDMATEFKGLVEEWQTRAEAAEALLKEAETLAKIAIGAEKMMNGAAIYFAADGERDDAKKLTKVATIMGEHARALKSKIGVKDE